MVFFAKDKKMAVTRNKRVASEEGMKYKNPTMAKKQIKHSSGWKTWDDNMVMINHIPRKVFDNKIYNLVNTFKLKKDGLASKKRYADKNYLTRLVSKEGVRNNYKYALYVKSN